MRTIVVSAADSGYFPFLRDLIESLQSVMGEDTPDLGVFDLGLTVEQREWLTFSGAELVRPGWGFSSKNLESKPETFKALTARAWLPEYFSQERLIWIDADIWLQNRDAVDWALAGLGHKPFAVAQELHPAYQRHYRMDEIFGKYGWFARFFGGAIAEQIGLTPSVNAGLFAAKRDAPHWREWRHILARVLEKEASPSCEQVSLDFAIHSRGLPTCWLPAHANWITHQALPIWDDGKLVDPIAPHGVISALHLTLGMKNKKVKIHQRSDTLKTINTTLRYKDIVSLVNQEGQCL